MNIPFFDLSRRFDNSLSEELEIVKKVVSRGKLVLDREVLNFEERFADYLGVGHCVSCGNGTDALELSLEVVGIGKGDHVIIPALGWVSVYTALKRAGAIPQFVDVSPVTGNLDPEKVQEAINHDTKAVILVHLYGNPADVYSIGEICDKSKLVFIEDCAQAHGAKVDASTVGSFGDVSIFSFYPTKNLAAWGDAGAVVTNNSNYAKKVKALRDYGRTSRQSFDGVGRNSRLDEVQAAILSKRLESLDRLNHDRQEIASCYGKCYNSQNQVVFQNSVFHQYPLLVKDRAEFIAKLNGVGIGSDIHYPFTIPQAYGISDLNFPNARKFAKHVVSIPIFPQLTNEEISYICDHLKRLEEYLL